jgi:hypothetical protein
MKTVLENTGLPSPAMGKSKRKPPTGNLYGRFDEEGVAKATLLLYRKSYSVHPKIIFYIEIM